MQTYKQVFKLGLSKTFQYRANFYLSLVSVIFPLIMQVFLWTGLFRASAGNEVFGYTYEGMLMYAFFACLLSKIISVNYVYEINEDIKNGGLSKYIVRPINYKLYIFGEYMGEKVGMMACSAILIIGVYFVGNYYAFHSIDIVRLISFFIILCLSVILNFFIYYIVSGLGFWMQDASSAIFITTLVGNIVSGGIFPLDIFPAQIQLFLKCLPFSYTNYFATCVLCGSVQGTKIIIGCCMQVIWLCVCWVLGCIVWKKGMKTYTAVGG